MVTERKTRIPVELEGTCMVREPAAGGSSSSVVVLLHGFSESGSRMFRALERALPADALVLSPDGVFPLPHKTDKGYRLRHCWYLYNPETDEYAVDMRAGVEYVLGLIARLAPGGAPVTLVGFSQGGYFAPFVAQREPRVSKVIGIACQFLNDELDGPFGFELHGVHGALDQVVDPMVSARDHQRLLARGLRGTYSVVEGASHAIDSGIAEKVAELLA